MEVLGLCRFSYLGHGGFRITHDSLEERRAFLYDPERMENRFRHFEAITLPSVVGQTDPDFTFLIVTGECLPEHYLERLLDLVEDHPQIVVQAYPPMRHRRAMNTAIRKAQQNPKETCLQFRLDDDDAMGVDFVERFRGIAQETRALWQKHDAVAVDFNSGYVFRAGPEGLEVCRHHYPYTAIALGLIVPPGSTQSIMRQGHHKLWVNVPTITIPNEEMYLRGHNDFNDSRMKTGGIQFEYTHLSAAQEAHFKARFNIDNERVRKIFSAPFA